MIATDEVDTVWVAQFKAYQERYGLDGEEAAVDIITYTDVSLMTPCRVPHARAADVPRNK